MDAGAPLPMTFNNNSPRFPPQGPLAVPAAGFASRGKGGGLKRLTLASAPKVGSISENPADQLPPTTAPRTSRSHLLAGLRTAPKTPSAVPASAPYHKTAHNQSAMGSHFQQNNLAYGNVPHTAIGSNFSSHAQQFSIDPGQQYYALPEQVLAPPSLDMHNGEEQMDPNMLAQLYATEMYLSQRQQQLQQLINYHTAQQQLATMNINGNTPYKTAHSSYPQTPVTPQQLNLFNQSQLQNIVTQEVPGQPGLYLVYNALTGQSTLAVDPTVQQQAQPELANSPPPPTPSHVNTNFDRSQYSTGSPVGGRSFSPPKHTSSPAPDVTPLPPPSANAFRRGHGRNRSSLVLKNDSTSVVDGGPKSAMVRPVGMPQTPQTGTFGPGQGRAGEHPIRQPYGPPPLEELQAKPTSKFEGSKNFVTRQRRTALSKLVRAGMERRGARPSTGGSGGSGGSVGSMTPVSDTEATFSVPSDNDSDSGLSTKGSGTLSGRPSIGSLRAAANGAIGSERKKSKENLDGLAATAEQKRSLLSM
jgi:hypothetical protein